MAILKKNYILDKIPEEEFEDIQSNLIPILNLEIQALHDQLFKELEANKSSSKAE